MALACRAQRGGNADILGVGVGVGIEFNCNHAALNSTLRSNDDSDSDPESAPPLLAELWNNHRPAGTAESF